MHYQKTYLIFFFTILIFSQTAGSCSTDPNFSGNFEASLNITGNYRVFESPDDSIQNITIVQTSNLVQGVDNNGTVYEGTVTGEINSVPINKGGNTSTITTTIEIGGIDSGGVAIILAISSIGYSYNPITNVREALNPDQDGDPTDLANTIFVQSLVGTYTDSTGLAGSLELVNNSIR